MNRRWPIPGWKVLLAAGFEERPVIALTAGEALSPALADQLRGRVKRLVNGYGPTETTVGVATFKASVGASG